jgi:hypothetical protein
MSIPEVDVKGYCRLSRTMITGCKKKKLGHPSEKLSGNVPCASWKAVIWSQVVWPICVAIIFVVAYMFVKSFGNHPSPLIRIGILAIGPVVWNAAVLACLFFVSFFGANHGLVGFFEIFGSASKVYTPSWALSRSSRSKGRSRNIHHLLHSTKRTGRGGPGNGTDAD